MPIYGRGRKDRNHSEIKSLLSKMGFFVFDISSAPKCPDLIAIDDSSAYLVEVKSENGKLRNSQERLFNNCPVKIYIIRNEQDINDFMDDIGYYQSNIE